MSKNYIFPLRFTENFSLIFSQNCTEGGEENGRMKDAGETKKKTNKRIEASKISNSLLHTTFVVGYNTCTHFDCAFRSAFPCAVCVCVCKSDIQRQIHMNHFQNWHSDVCINLANKLKQSSA